MKKYLSKNLNSIYFNFIFIIVSIFFLSKLYNSYDIILGDGWAYNNLFINYSAGFVRRGLLGEIFLNVNETYNVSPLHFFTNIFFIAYFLLIYFFYKLLKKYSDYKFFVTIVALSPALLLFYIYDLNVFLSKDIFINIGILFHAFIVNKGISEKKYKQFLYFILIPILILNILNHENQVLFIPFHLLITFYFFNKKYKGFVFDNFKPYLILTIPFISILLTSGSFEKLSIINNSINEFDASIYSQFAGNLNLAIGGFIKWHFHHANVFDFLRLFFCVLFSLFFLYSIFDYLIKNQVFKINKIILKKYTIIILPSFLIFFLMLDHGRSLNMLSIHFVSFYLILEIKHKELKNLFLRLNNNFLIKRILIIFIIFYLNFWFLPQGGGISGIGNFKTGNVTTLFQGTLLDELKIIFLIVFNYIDAEIINLPRIYI